MQDKMVSLIALTGAVPSTPTRLDIAPAASRAFQVAEEVEGTLDTRLVPALTLDSPVAATEDMGSLQMATLASVDLESLTVPTVHLASTAPEPTVLYSRLAATKTL